RKTAETLRGRGITHIFVSPFLRTMETADIVREALGLGASAVAADERLREFAFGELNGKPLRSFQDFRQTHPYATPVPGGESDAAAKKRFGDFLYENEKALANATILIITHGIGFESLDAIVAGADERRSKALISGTYAKLGEVKKLAFVPLPHNDEY